MNQMCYCCRKLVKLVISIEFVGGRGRPWEAVGGRGALIGSERSDQISEPIRGARPPTASHGLPNSASHGLPRPPIASASHNLLCDLSEPIREHGLPRESDLRGRIRPHRLRAMQSDPRGRLTDFTAKRIALPGVRSAVRVRSVRPNSASHHKVMWSVWEAVCVRGRAQTPTASDSLTDHMTLSESPICEADLLGRGSPKCEADRTLPGEGVRSSGQSHWFHGCNRCDWPVESDRPHTSDSHGLTDRPHRSDSLTDGTLWQIWQIRSCLLIDYWLLVIDFIAI